MWKVSILSMLVCILLLMAYFLGGVTDMHAFKVMLYIIGGICLLSTGYGMYELNKTTKKIQRKHSEQ